LTLAKVNESQTMAKAGRQFSFFVFSRQIRGLSEKDCLARGAVLGSGPGVANPYESAT
jgi:hypothetical protein